ncbi:MAG: transporter, family, fosmidomycin resistance protein [Pyrinomonadaceae bacterium]|jgi:FSR family fosmidomycin resistance protein-like MFS transporter|nr:transporter, family, fosmidomycin resistance protein [Pyrinomonadaceae bacterium]
MSNHARSKTAPPSPPTRACVRALSRFTFTLLAIEFLDELVDGSRQAAWPLIRRDLSLSYTDIGLLLTVPNFVGNFIEPPLALLGDTRHRRAIILVGGVCFALALLLVAHSSGFASLLAAFVLFYPASGAFVSLSQAALMDAAPARREQNMARWAFAGSLGILAGSLALNVAVAGGATWRAWFGVMSALALSLVLAARRFAFAANAPRPAPPPERADASHERTDKTAERDAADAPDAHRPGIRQGARDAWRAVRRGAVLRWLVLLEFSDLMLDGFHAFLALYFVDVVGASDREAGVAIAVWTSVGLCGDLLLIPLLERVRGLSYLRWSALATLVLFPAFLLAPNLYVKLLLLGLVGITNAGWYSILKAQLYASMPERSGAALALNNLSGLFGGMIPLALGLVAERFGLDSMMWLLLAAPLMFLVAIPRKEKSLETC